MSASTSTQRSELAPGDISPIFPSLIEQRTLLSNQMTHDRSFLPSFGKLSAILILSVATLSMSCRPKDKNQNGEAENKAVIFVSVPPQAFLVKAIAGEEFDVRSLIEPGQDPHHWLPSPKQTLALSKSAAWLPANLPFEQKLFPEIWNREKKKKPEIFPTIIEQNSEHDHHLETDPHSWLSIPLLIDQTDVVVEFIRVLNPDKTSLYRERGEALTSKLSTLHDELTEQLAPYKGRSFLIFHNALGHFAHTYGLTQKVIQSGDAPPDPKRIRKIIKQAKEDQTTTVFIQPQFDDQSARMIADAIGGQVVVIDPMAEDVLANLKHIADTLTDSFSQADP